MQVEFKPMLDALFIKIKEFAKTSRAVAAVEFAIVLPLALLIYLGAAEVSDGVMTNRKLATLTRTLVDLLSQQSTSFQTSSTPTPANAITSSTLSSLMTSAQMLIYPKQTTTLQMTLSAIDINNNTAGLCCVATVRWSYTQNGTLRPCGIPLTAGAAGAAGPSVIASQLLPAGTALTQPISMLVADVFYVYVPVAGSQLFNFSPQMSRTEYMMPRTTGQIVSAALPASGTQHGQVCY